MCIRKLVVSIVFVLILVFLCLVVGENGPCLEYYMGCCPYTRWDLEINKCVECPVGYHWINCSLECRFPLYGKMCQQECLCNKSQCDFVNGCKHEIFDIESFLFYQALETNFSIPHASS
uniref:Uncharacterized protein n=1 Tax=Magallana gigas TaxID=29159 RepID=A0A8W8JMG9_MAGGI